MLDETHNPSQSQDSRVQALIDQVNQYYAQEGGTDNHIDQDAALTGPAVFWMRLDSGAVTTDSVVPLRTSKIWGVFMLEAGHSFVMPDEGGSIALTVENKCPLAPEAAEGT